MWRAERSCDNRVIDTRSARWRFIAVSYIWKTRSFSVSLAGSDQLLTVASTLAHTFRGSIFKKRRKRAINYLIINRHFSTLKPQPSVRSVDQCLHPYSNVWPLDRRRNWWRFAHYRIQEIWIPDCCWWKCSITSDAWNSFTPWLRVDHFQDSIISVRFWLLSVV